MAMVAKGEQGAQAGARGEEGRALARNAREEEQARACEGQVTSLVETLETKKQELEMMCANAQASMQAMWMTMAMRTGLPAVPLQHTAGPSHFLPPAGAGVPTPVTSSAGPSGNVLMAIPNGRPHVYGRSVGGTAGATLFDPTAQLQPYTPGFEIAKPRASAQTAAQGPAVKEAKGASAPPKTPAGSPPRAGPPQHAKREAANSIGYASVVPKSGMGSKQVKAEKASQKLPGRKKAAHPKTKNPPADSDADKICVRCKATTTPMWRRFKGELYCNACGLFAARYTSSLKRQQLYAQRKLKEARDGKHGSPGKAAKPVRTSGKSAKFQAGKDKRAKASRTGDESSPLGGLGRGKRRRVVSQKLRDQETSSEEEELDLKPTKLPKFGEKHEAAAAARRARADQSEEQEARKADEEEAFVTLATLAQSSCEPSQQPCEEECNLPCCDADKQGADKQGDEATSEIVPPAVKALCGPFERTYIEQMPPDKVKHALRLSLVLLRVNGMHKSGQLSAADTELVMREVVAHMSESFEAIPMAEGGGEAARELEKEILSVVEQAKAVARGEPAGEPAQAQVAPDPKGPDTKGTLASNLKPSTSGLNQSEVGSA